MARWSIPVWLKAGLPALVILALVSFNCSDSGFNPPPVEPKEYMVYAYVGAGFTDTYFSLNTATLAVDTFDIGDGLWHTGLSASADGSRLYVVDTSGILVIDAETQSTLAVLPYFGPVSVSPNNRYLAVGGDGGVRVLDASNYGVIFYDTLRVLWGTFSLSGDMFYAYRGDTTGRYVYRLDLAKGNEVTMIRIPIEGGFAVDLEPSPDEAQIYLYRKRGIFNYLFEVYDIAADSVTFRQYLSPGAGNLKVSRDGRYVYLTDAGSILVGPPAKYSFARFDTELKTIDSIWIDNLCPQYGGPFFCSDFVITPDDRLLISNSPFLQNGLVVYDLETMEMVTGICLDNNKQFLYLTCQSMR